ncbi:MAG: hypothetical protein WEA56_07605 [Balneolaceae bacterium]
MVKELLSSIRGNFVRRTTNPFLGTLLIVWIIRNWDFVYSLFNFDSSFSLNDRLDFFQAYFNSYTILEGLITVSVTFAAIIITYLLLNLSRFIVNFSDKAVTPKVLEWSDKGSVVDKEVFLAREKRIQELEVRIDREREEKLKAKAEVEQLEQKLVEMESNSSSKKSVNPEMDKETITDQEVENILELLHQNDLDELFKEVASFILNGQMIELSTGGEFAKFELIKLNHIEGGKASYDLTPLGRLINRKLYLN